MNMSEATQSTVWPLDKFQAVMSRCPFNKWLGLEARKVSEEGVEIFLPWRDELLSSPEAQSMHGGRVRFRSMRLSARSWCMTAAAD